MKQNILYNIFKRVQVLFFVFKEISKSFKRKPPRRGQPLYKGQLASPQCVLSSEVLLYIDVQSTSHFLVSVPHANEKLKVNEWCG